MDYFIRDFGEVTDGKADATEAAQMTIDTCHANGGGRVVDDRILLRCPRVKNGLLRDGSSRNILLSREPACRPKSAPQALNTVRR